MKIEIDRKYKKETYTISNLTIDKKWESNCLEDKDRGLKKGMPLSELLAKKVPGETAIPSGEYVVRMDLVSPKYSKIDWYKKNCGGGRMPRVMDVPGYDGILFHPGTTALDTKGCIVVGMNTAKGKVLNSRATFLKFWKKLDSAYQRGETIKVKIA